jgi:hypothetical protein
MDADTVDTLAKLVAREVEYQLRPLLERIAWLERALAAVQEFKAPAV